MKIIHPNWSERQLGNLLYWQSSIQKLLKDCIIDILNMNYDIDIYLLFCGSGLKNKFINLYQPEIYSMEAVGINVFKTLKNNNINFELKPKNKVILVTLLCSNEKVDIKEELFVNE